MTFPRWTLWSGSLLLLLCACGETAAEPDAGRDRDAGAVDATDRLALVAHIRGGVNSTAVTLVDRAGPPAELDLTTSLSVPGLGDAFGSPFEPDVIFTWSGESPRLTRYRAGADGSFTEEGVLAFDGQLLTPSNGLVATDFFVVAPDKAYVLDGLGAAVLIFDPLAMTLGERVPLPPDLPVPGILLGPVVGADPLIVDDRLIVSIGFTNSLRDDISATSFIVFLNILDDTIERVLTPDECGFLLHARATAGGDLLFGTGVRSTAFELAFAGARGGPSCILRVDGETFEAEPIAAPGALTDGRVAGGFTLVSDSSAFARIFEESALDGDPAMTTRIELNGGPYWRWGFIEDIATGDFRFVDDGSSPRPGFAITRSIDGVRYGIEFLADFTGSRLIELRPDGTIVGLTETAQSLQNVFGMRL